MRKLFRLGALIILMITMGQTANTQSISEFRARHKALLAKQTTVRYQLQNEETKRYAMGVYDNDPNSDLYTTWWDSDQVNAYQGAIIPQAKLINLQGYHMPVKHRLVTSHFGYRRQFGRMHRGVDLKANVGDTIVSVFDGKVRLTRFERTGYGFYVVVRHDNGLETVYAHLSRFLVKPNQYVKAGQPIALSGNTGRSTGPHLHFETRFMGIAINPEKIFDFTKGVAHSNLYVFNKSTVESENRSRSISNSANASKRNRKRR